MPMYTHKKRLKGFKFHTFIGFFSSDITAMKGLNLCHTWNKQSTQGLKRQGVLWSTDPLAAESQRPEINRRRQQTTASHVENTSIPASEKHVSQGRKNFPLHFLLVARKHLENARDVSYTC